VCARPTPLRIPGLLLTRSCAGPRRRHGRSSSHALRHAPTPPTQLRHTRRRTAAPLTGPTSWVRWDTPACLGWSGSSIRPAAPTGPAPAAAGGQVQCQTPQRVSHSQGHTRSHQFQPGIITEPRAVSQPLLSVGCRPRSGYPTWAGARGAAGAGPAPPAPATNRSGPARHYRPPQQAATPGRPWPRSWPGSPPPRRPPQPAAVGVDPQPLQPGRHRRP